MASFACRGERNHEKQDGTQYEAAWVTVACTEERNERAYYWVGNRHPLWGPGEFGEVVLGHAEFPQSVVESVAATLLWPMLVGQIERKNYAG